MIIHIKLITSVYQMYDKININLWLKLLFFVVYLQRILLKGGCYEKLFC